MRALECWAFAAALAASACCPVRSGPPGDQQDVAWRPPSTEEPLMRLPCPEGSITIEQSWVLLKGCTIRGSVHIRGPARNGEDPVLRARSRRPDYVAWLRAQAPRGVYLVDVTVISNGNIPVYVAPGVTDTTLEHVVLRGPSGSVMLYLDAESRGTTVLNSDIDGRRAKREAIAIDASGHNSIRSSNVVGDVNLYRNCGEGGVSRHTTPSYNAIVDNQIAGTIRLGSREGDRCYCDEDADSAYGSGPSDLDHAQFNVVVRNNGAPVVLGKSARNNQVE